MNAEFVNALRSAFPAASEAELLDCLRITAIHEAGHAVIPRVLSIGCGGVTIIPDADSGGHSVIEGPWRTLWRWEGQGGPEIRDNKLIYPPGSRPHGTYESALRGRILVFMAGWAAEVEILGECRGADGDDRYQIGLMLEELPIPGGRSPAAWERYESRLRAKAHALVRRHRAAIERVAAALEERGSLTAEDIDA